MKSIHLNKDEKLKKRKLIFFLKQNNMYENFIHNMKNFPCYTSLFYSGEVKTLPISLDRLIREYPMSFYMSSAFKWDGLTREEMYKWRRIEGKWNLFIHYSWDKNLKTYNLALNRK